jgi:serine protease AprX
MTTRNIRILQHRLFIAILLMLQTGWLSATTSYFFYVQFSNKNNTPYSLSNPSAYLSQRAIDRRTSFGISIDSTDLPVSPNYVSQIQNAGITVHCKSKWLNGVTVILTDSSKMSAVRSLPFVKKVQYTGLRSTALAVPKKVKSEATAYNYGAANTQINQLNGSFLHNAGYTGKNIVISVMDAGFYNVNSNPAFDSLRIQGRLLGTKDFAEPGSNIYTLDAHGAYVLSTMTANLPGTYVGTAPNASFWLIRTEYAPTEYVVETDFWTSGIEYADSVGVDVINSSLGYTQFDDASMNYTYADMNGKVSHASIAANMASRKGIIVCNSAGNDGNTTWHYIGSPADAEGILSVGSTTSLGVASAFSSFGPSFDGRIKPEVSAMGSSTSLVNASGTPTSGNGTSFSSPIMAGLVTCLLQAYKENNIPFTVETVRSAIIHSGNLYNAPTAQLGYGIPNFEYAFKSPKLTTVKETKDSRFSLEYHSQDKTIHFLAFDPHDTIGKTIRIYSITGCLLYEKNIDQNITIIPTHNLSTGIYIISITGNGAKETRKIIIQ